LLVSSIKDAELLKSLNGTTKPKPGSGPKQMNMRTSVAFQVMVELVPPISPVVY
jgi:hypothetical protein